MDGRMEPKTLHQHHDPLSEFIGKGLDPILPMKDYGGYDSDPEFHSIVDGPPSRAGYRESSLMDNDDLEDDLDSAEEDKKIQTTVQVRVAVLFIICYQKRGTILS